MIWHSIYRPPSTPNPNIVLELDTRGASVNSTEVLRARWGYSNSDKWAAQWHQHYCTDRRSGAAAASKLQGQCTNTKTGGVLNGVKLELLSMCRRIDTEEKCTFISTCKQLNHLSLKHLFSILKKLVQLQHKFWYVLDIIKQTWWDASRSLMMDDSFSYIQARWKSATFRTRRS